MKLEKHPLLQRSAYNKWAPYLDALLNIRLTEPSTSGSLAKPRQSARGLLPPKESERVCRQCDSPGYI